jgi:hypothetical protein
MAQVQAIQIREIICEEGKGQCDVFFSLSVCPPSPLPFPLFFLNKIPSKK